MTESKKTMKRVLPLLALGLALPLALAAAEAKIFSHKQHLEEGAECDTCHQVHDDGLPTVKESGCADCHDDGAPPHRLAHPARKVELAFPHATHQDVAECKDCHGPTITDAQKPGAPLVPYARCRSCHQENDVETPHCKSCHGDDFKPPWRKLKIDFPHKAHEKALACDDCHKHPVQTKPGAPLMGLADCRACHEKSKVALSGTACVKCHGQDARKQRPADHDAAWGKRHGQESRWRVFDQHGRDCKTCHPNDGCKNCHRKERPRSHNSLWRVRTHGRAAAWDREACKTCHETGSCIHCHRITEPLNHKGAWRSTHGLAAGVRDNEHCTVCHQPAWCAACHAGQQ